MAATSGTATWEPANSDIMLLAFSRCKIMRADITPDHLADGRMELLLLLSEWENDQPHLWEVDLQTIQLQGGQATYTLPPDTVLVTDAYYRPFSGSPVGGWGANGWGQGGWGNAAAQAGSDRILWSISRSEYAAYPDKSRQSPSTVYWFNRVDPPQLTFYPTPSAGTLDQVLYYRVRRIQDAYAVNGQSPDVVNRYIAAMADGLTANLSMTYAPDQYPMRNAKYMRTLKSAKVQDREQAPLRVVPAIGAYYRSTC